MSRMRIRLQFDPRDHAAGVGDLFAAGRVAVADHGGAHGGEGPNSSGSIPSKKVGSSTSRMARSQSWPTKATWPGRAGS